MELTTTTFVSVDGVMQGVGGPGETAVADSSAADGTTPLFDTRYRDVRQILGEASAKSSVAIEGAPRPPL